MINIILNFAQLLLTKLGVSPEEGQGLAEYALILLLIAFALIGALTTFGQDLISIYEQIVADLPF